MGGVAGGYRDSNHRGKMMDLSELKKEEQQKRDAAYDPAQRW